MSEKLKPCPINENNVLAGDMYYRSARCPNRAPDPVAEKMAALLGDFVRMFLDTERYPDPDTITTGLRIFLPGARDAMKEYEAAKRGEEGKDSLANLAGNFERLWKLEKSKLNIARSALKKIGELK